MATGRFLVVAAGLSLMLAGCVTGGGAYDSYGYAPSGYGYAPGYSSGYGYGRPSYGYEAPRRMSGRSTAALAEGCKQRYYPGTNKYSQCVNGERKSGDSLVEGCTRLYKNNPHAYGKCLKGR